MNEFGAVVLAGGQGTRMRSAVPKSLHPLLGRPLAAWPATVAVLSGCETVVVVTSPDAGPLQAAVAEALHPSPVRFAVQRHPRGTGDAVLAAQEATRDLPHLLILNGDVPLLRTATLRRLAEAYREADETLAFATCLLDTPGAYGRVLRDAGGEVQCIREARDASPEERLVREVNVGVYAVRRDLLYEALSRVGTDNAQQEIYLTDIVSHVVRRGHRAVGMPLHDPIEMQGVNTRVELAAAARVLRRRLTEEWMLAGVTFDDPESVHIEPSVRIGRDTVVGSGVVLRGRTTVGAHCQIGPHAVIADSTIHDHVVVGPHAVVDSETIAPGTRLFVAQERRLLRAPPHPPGEE